MLSKLSEQVGYCLERARDSAAKAARASDDSTRQDYLDLERRWLMLAKSYELTERVGFFSDEMKNRLTILNPPAPPHPDLPRIVCACCGKRMRLRQIEPSRDGSRNDVISYDCVCGFICEQTSRR